MDGEQPATLPAVPPPPTDQPVANASTLVRHPIIPLPQKQAGDDLSTSSGSDWVLVYDLCAQQDQTGTALYIRNGKGTLRAKPFLKRGETARMVVIGNNPTSGTLTINTSGIITQYDTTNGLMKLPGTQLPTGAPPPNKEVSTLSAEEKAVEANRQLIDNYRAALEAIRKTRFSQDCLSEETFHSYYDAPVPNSKLSRDELMQEQQRLLADLPDGLVKRNGWQSLAALQAEVDQWMSLRDNNSVSGTLVDAAGNDFVRFSASRRSPDGTNRVLLGNKDVPVYGNFRINVSTGFLISRLVDHSYLAVDEKAWRQTNSTSPPSTGEPTSTTGTARKVPVLDSPGWGSVGVGALAHFYVTTRTFVTPAFSVGASLNASGKYTALFGGSLIWGQDQRIVLTAGYSFGPVTRLQEPFREGIAYEFSGATFPTSTRTQGGWSFGLTWNLSSKRTVVPLSN